MITTPEIICDVFSFLDKDQIERTQLVSQFWHNVIVRHNNILPLRQFEYLKFYRGKIHLYVTEENLSKDLVSYIIKFDEINLSKVEENVSSRYLQLTVDEVLTNLNDVVFDSFEIEHYGKEYNLDYILNMMKLITTKTGGRFRGKRGILFEGRFGSQLNEIFDNYIIVDELYLGHYSFLRELDVIYEIVQLPSTPKEISLGYLYFKENDEAFHFTDLPGNRKLNGANRLTIELKTSYKNYENFIKQWFELYTHEDPASLVGNFELRCFNRCFDSVLDSIKTFLNNTQLRIKYSLQIKEFRHPYRRFTNHYLNRRCVLHETDSFALVIEMRYREITDMSSINASDLDQPSCNNMESMSFCVKSL